MDYAQALHFLYHQLPLFSHTGAKAYKADLKNTLTLCKLFDNPQHKIKCIHVAGTNGKGSVSHMLAAIFQKHHYKTGLYTSPHLQDFRERIKINGVMIPTEFVVDFVEKSKAICEAIDPSFFELTFVMALEYFASENIEIAIIETGLGGRLDSTNVVHPLLSIITNIGMDHMDILGDSLEKIAIEKAGIIKPATPVVIGEYIPETKEIFIKHSKINRSPINFAQDDYSVLSAKYTDPFLDVLVKTNETQLQENYHLDLVGMYQQKNLLTVIAALEQLKAVFILDGEKIKSALSQVQLLTGLQGRWEVIHDDPKVVLDVAHNADGIIQLIQQLSIMDYNNCHIVFGMVKDKDINKVLELLPVDAVYYFTKAPIPRALPEDELLEKAGKHHLKGKSFAMVNEAFKAALQNALSGDVVIVCGSVFIVGEIERRLVDEVFPNQKSN